MMFVVNRLSVGQVYFPVLRFYPVSIIPSVLRAHLYLYAALTRGTNGQSLGDLLKSSALSEVRGLSIKEYRYASLNVGGIHSEKCVVRRFRRCANVIQCTYTNLDSIAYYRYVSLNVGDTF